jgi:hypothetical protein
VLIIRMTAISPGHSMSDSLYIEFKAESHNEVNLCGLFDSRSGGPTPS